MAKTLPLILSALVVLVIGISIPITANLVQKSQDIRSRAALPDSGGGSNSCGECQKSEIRANTERVCEQKKTEMVNMPSTETQCDDICVQYEQEKCRQEAYSCTEQYCVKYDEICNTVSKPCNVSCVVGEKDDGRPIYGQCPSTCDEQVCRQGGCLQWGNQSSTCYREKCNNPSCLRTEKQNCRNVTATKQVPRETGECLVWGNETKTETVCVPVSDGSSCGNGVCQNGNCVAQTAVQPPSPAPPAVSPDERATLPPSPTPTTNVSQLDRNECAIDEDCEGFFTCGGSCTGSPRQCRPKSCPQPTPVPTPTPQPISQEQAVDRNECLINEDCEAIGRCNPSCTGRPRQCRWNSCEAIVTNLPYTPPKPTSATIQLTTPQIPAIGASIPIGGATIGYGSQSVVYGPYAPRVDIENPYAIPYTDCEGLTGNAYQRCIDRSNQAAIAAGGTAAVITSPLWGPAAMAIAPEVAVTAGPALFKVGATTFVTGLGTQIGSGIYQNAILPNRRGYTLEEYAAAQQSADYFDVGGQFLANAGAGAAFTGQTLYEGGLIAQQARNYYSVKTPSQIPVQTEQVLVPQKQVTQEIPTTNSIRASLSQPSYPSVADYEARRTTIKNQLIIDLRTRYNINALPPNINGDIMTGPKSPNTLWASTENSAFDIPPVIKNITVGDKGQGIGTQIVQTWEKAMSEMGYTRVGITNVVLNPQSRNFWTKLGYAYDPSTGVDPNYLWIKQLQR